MTAVNLRGVFFTSQAVARTMVAAGRGGRIVNISSQGGLVGLPDAAVYCASKGGVNMMTKALALEWAKHGVTVNAIAPTFIYTPGRRRSSTSRRCARLCWARFRSAGSP